jgi:hypothetical protein
VDSAVDEASGLSLCSSDALSSFADTEERDRRNCPATYANFVFAVV